MYQIIAPPSAVYAMRRLEENGFEAYVVGGCVRDSLLGRPPNDWDITTNALPEELLRCFSDHRVIETGIKHGTVAVLCQGDLLEITTYRIDGRYEDNRHPTEVTFSKELRDDLSRRDFTVNAMAYHPRVGLVDQFGGATDLEAGLIRCVGDPKSRFEEDGLRILRAIRFASILGFSLEERTAQAVHECRHLLQNIAAERIREEFNKLICGKNAVPILREFADVIAEFIPELRPCFGFDQRTKYHCYDVWEHTLHALDSMGSTELIPRLGILLHDIGKPAKFTMDEKGGHFKGHGEESMRLTDEILRRLRYDNATRELLLQLVKYHDVALQPQRKALKRSLIRFGSQGIRYLLEIQYADRVAHAPDNREMPDFYAVIPDMIRQLEEEDTCLSLKTLAVKGSDLIALGYAPGPVLGAALQRLLDAVIDDEVPNEKDALLNYLQNK